MHTSARPATMEALKALEEKLLRECATLERVTSRSIARLGLSNIDESWTTAFSSRLVLQNLRRRRQMQDALRVWRTLIELSSVGLEHSPYETLRNQASRSEDLSRNVKSLWSQFSDLYSLCLFRMDTEDITFVEDARPTLEAAFESLEEKTRLLTVKMGAWTSCFETFLTLDGLDVASSRIGDRTQTDVSIFVEITGPHFDRLRRLEDDRKVMKAWVQSQGDIVDDMDSTMARVEAYLEDLASQKILTKRAIASLLTIVDINTRLASMLTDKNDTVVPAAMISRVLTTYNEVRLLSEEMNGMADPLRKVLRGLIKRMHNALPSSAPSQ